LHLDAVDREPTGMLRIGSGGHANRCFQTSDGTNFKATWAMM
jgi:hypothetical protein